MFASKIDCSGWANACASHESVQRKSSVSGASDTAALLSSGVIEVHGPEGAAKRFVSYFEEVFTVPVTFYLR